VGVVPGNSFRLGGEGFVNYSFATAYEKIDEALRRMEQFCNQLYQETNNKKCSIKTVFYQFESEKYYSRPLLS
jgi:hypothetical protein